LEDFSGAGFAAAGAFASELGFESLDAAVFGPDSPFAGASAPAAALPASLGGGEEVCGFFPSFP
jgi:hypothetical protein